MLDELIVKNLGVIEKAEFRPDKGLVVITGETGTGKTLLLGALRLLMGQAPDFGAVGPFGEQIEVGGRWILADGEVVATRRVPRKGRSRGYLNAMVASASSLADTVGELVEIIGQQEHLRLRSSARIRQMLDAALDRHGRQIKEYYRKSWQEMARLEDIRSALGGGRAALERELDMVSFQARDIESAGFSPGEDERLLADIRRLRNREALRVHLGRTREGVNQSRESLAGASGELDAALRLDPELDDLMSALDGVEQLTEDLFYRLESAAEDLEADHGTLEELEQRLARLGDLRRKYGSDLTEVLEFGAAAERRREEIKELLTATDNLESDLAEADRKVRRDGKALSDARRTAAQTLCDTSLGYLRELGFGRPVLGFEITDSPPSAHGCDHVRLLFSSDERLAPGEIGRVASGGELSRLVLALRLAERRHASATMVFDEVDAGLGGAVAVALGRKLADVSRGAQVLCVTHLASVAAFANQHWVIERQGPSATVRVVEGEDRIAELARMMSGDPESPTGREAARELLVSATSQ